MIEIFDPRFEPLPVNPVEYPRRLAHDLAWGKHNGIWSAIFRMHQASRFEWEFSTRTDEINFREYLAKCWGDKKPDPKLLVTYRYLEELGNEGGGISVYTLTEFALRLPEEKSSASIFISYAREQSSALALLIVARFKEFGRVPFLDMNPDRDGQENKLELGGTWHAALEKQIQDRDHFLLLLGPTTLQSPYVCREIEWAIKYGKNIIPIWHNHFRKDSDGHIPVNIMPEIREVIERNQGEIVIAESPKQYNAAIDALLAKFGIAP